MDLMQYERQIAHRKNIFKKYDSNNIAICTMCSIFGLKFYSSREIDTIIHDQRRSCKTNDTGKC